MIESGFEEAAGGPRVVLVAPEGGANVGSVCRAIKNMGAGGLCIVDGAFDETDARRMAVHAVDVLEAAVRVDSFAEAVAGCARVVGTTAKAGACRELARPVRESAQDLVGWQLEHAREGIPAEVAVVFGRERTGLTNAEIAACHQLVYIPTAPAYRSLNLAQAVLLVLYEMWMARLAASGETAARTAREQGVAHREAPADAGEVEAMFVALEEALVGIGFLDEVNPGHVMASLRSVLTRAGMDARELRILRGLARQIRWFGDTGHEVLAAKRARGDKLR